MMFYDYTDVPRDQVDAFIQTRELGRLVTVGEQNEPHIGLYPFVYAGTHIEMHVNRADEQLADLRAHPRCVFEVDEILAVIPSYWIDAQDAVMATAYHRTVVLDCEAGVSEEPQEIAAQQMRLMARYQPEGGFRPLTEEEPLYRAAISTIAALRLEVFRARVKFKLGQNRASSVRAQVVEQLRRRGLPGDARAAEALQWTINRERDPLPGR